MPGALSPMARASTRAIFQGDMSMRTEEPEPIRRQDYRPPDYHVDHVELTFDLDPAATLVTARLHVRRAAGAGATPLSLDGDGLTLRGLALDGVALAPEAFTATPDRLTVHAPPEAFTLDLETVIDPSANTRLEGLYRSGGTYCTQCEAEGFRRITYFTDRPDVMATFLVELRANPEECPVLLANGNRVAEGRGPDGRAYAVWHDPFPKPCYLFALVAGRLACRSDSLTTRSGRRVALNIHVEPGREDRCAFAMAALKRAMRWDEEVYGLEYDLDEFNIVAVDDFNYGAMENKGLNIFNARYVLADPETATDQDYASIEDIVAHEYFHNWTGNRVGCRDWFQLSLKEGLTVFREQQFAASQRSAVVERIRAVQSLRARQFPEDAGPFAHPVRPDTYREINNFYTPTVYEKGAELIRMMHALLGPEGYRRGMALYFQRHDGQAVTCDDLVAALGQASGADLDRFALWYRQAGTPTLRVDARHSPTERTCELRIEQSVPPTPGQPRKEPMAMPLAVGLVDPAGRDLPLRLEGEPADAAATTRVLTVSAARQSFRFVEVAEPPVPSLNRGFSCPVLVEDGLSAEDLAFLIAHDSDPFNRWEAGQRAATELLLGHVADRQAGRLPRPDGLLVEALRRVLADRNDPAFTALAMTLPSEESLGQRLPIIDVETVHTVVHELRQSLARQLRTDFLALYHALGARGPYRPDPESAGRRSLRNVALNYLASLDGDAEALELVDRQFRSADNMTDRLAALTLLTHKPVPQRERALASFYERFRDDPVVLTKWLHVQAVSTLPETLARVRALTRHPAFSWTSPNKVRAVVGGFAESNPLRFHAGDGSGYDFVAEQILALDPVNPHVAARLVRPLGRWRRYDRARQERMRKALERILGAASLSTAVREMAETALAEA